MCFLFSFVVFGVGGGGGGLKVHLTPRLLTGRLAKRRPYNHKVAGSRPEMGAIVLSSRRTRMLI